MDAGPELPGRQAKQSAARPDVEHRRARQIRHVEHLAKRVLGPLDALGRERFQELEPILAEFEPPAGSNLAGMGCNLGRHAATSGAW